MNQSPPTKLSNAVKIMVGILAAALGFCPTLAVAQDKANGGFPTGILNVDVPKGVGELSPLESAIINKNKREVIRLLQRKTDPNQQDQYGNSPVELAANISDSWYLDALLKSGGNPNVEDKYGNSPVFDAMLSSSFNNVKLLIKAGANINHQNGTKKTPLAEAIETDEYDVALYLLEIGANPSIKDDLGHTIADDIQGQPSYRKHSRDEEKVIVWLKEKKLWKEKK